MYSRRQEINGHIYDEHTLEAVSYTHLTLPTID